MLAGAGAGVVAVSVAAAVVAVAAAAAGVVVVPAAGVPWLAAGWRLCHGCLGLGQLEFRELALSALRGGHFPRFLNLGSDLEHGLELDLSFYAEYIAGSGLKR